MYPGRDGGTTGACVANVHPQCKHRLAGPTRAHWLVPSRIPSWHADVKVHDGCGKKETYTPDANATAAAAASAWSMA